jgi:hypothetical protein
MKAVKFDPSTKSFVDTLEGSSGVKPGRVVEGVALLNNHLDLIKSFGIDEAAWIERLGIGVVGNEKKEE